MTTLLSRTVFKSVIEIHYKRPLLTSMNRITCKEDAETVLRNSINIKQIDLRERMWVILLTHSNQVLGVSEVASGSSIGVMINAKYIFQLILLTNASAFILAHNHPSGSLKLSASDIQMTKKIKRLAKLMDVTLLDHIILTSEGATSFVMQGHL